MSIWLGSTKTKVQDAIFKRVHGNNLIYNVCWEDPEVDRYVLNFTTESKIAMITSAGCNALDYLLDDVAEINCIDMNPRQNAVLELKKVLIKHANFSDLFDFFGRGVHSHAEQLYRDELREHLSKPARKIWDKKIDYFTPKKNQKTYLFRGTSGNIAWMVHKYLKTHKKLRHLIDELFQATTLDEQKAIYDKIEEKLWNGLITWIMNQQLTMTLIGVPEAQKKLIDEKYPGGMGEYLKNSLRNVFTKLPISENYFWYGYLYGCYSETCSPNYLKKENFETLRNRVDRINQYTIAFADFLELYESTLSHFILLDHQDWMAAHLPLELEREWKAIFSKSTPKAKALLRSAGITVDFLPDIVQKRVKFDEALSEKYHLTDRVGTYASMHVGTILGENDV